MARCIRKYFLSLAIFLLSASDANTAARVAARVITVNKAVTGKLVRPVLIRFTRLSDKALYYRFTSGAHEHAMIWPSDTVDTPYVLLADVNFDGYADLWLTGWTEGQGRVRKSAVWLFSPATKQYELHQSLSQIGNLEVDPQGKTLQGGIANCGCAGSCFFYDTYLWQDTSLLPVARREQQCVENDLRYREWALMDGALKIVHEEHRSTDDADHTAAHSHFINWAESKRMVLPFTDDAAIN
jgi:hypothetical protein